MALSSFEEMPIGAVRIFEVRNAVKFEYPRRNLCVIRIDMNPAVYNSIMNSPGDSVDMRTQWFGLSLRGTLYGVLVKQDENTEHIEYIVEEIDHAI